MIFDLKKWLWKSEFCCFRPWILKWPKGQKCFYGRFHSSLALLILKPLNSGACRKITLGTLLLHYYFDFFLKNISCSYSVILYYGSILSSSIYIYDEILAFSCKNTDEQMYDYFAKNKRFTKKIISFYFFVIFIVSFRLKIDT